MKDFAEIFEKVFMITGQRGDPRAIDFTFNTQEKVTKNPDGTPAIKEYYMNYDRGTDTFSDLAVKCSYKYDTNPTEIRTEDIEWYFEDGSVGTTRQLVQVYQTV